MTAKKRAETEPKPLPMHYCEGHRTYAFRIGSVWFCWRCGDKIKVVT